MVRRGGAPVGDEEGGVDEPAHTVGQAGLLPGGKRWKTSGEELKIGEVEEEEESTCWRGW